MLTRLTSLLCIFASVALSLGAVFPPAHQEEGATDAAPAKRSSADFGAWGEASPTWGVRVRKVRAVSPAALAGLQVGDLILGVGGKAVESSDELRTAVGSLKPRSWTEVVIRRGDEIHVLDCLLGDHSRRAYPFHPDSPNLEQALEFLQVQRGEQVADIGFGNAWLTYGLTRATGREGQVYAVELIEFWVNLIRKLEIPNLTAVLSKANDVCLEENSLDLAVMADVVSHIDEAARPEFYASLARALRPDGRLVAFCPHGEGRLRLDEFAGFGFHPRDPEEFEGLGEKELDRLVQRGIRLVYREPSSAGER